VHPLGTAGFFSLEASKNKGSADDALNYAGADGKRPSNLQHAHSLSPHLLYPLNELRIGR
jgi:hypothetical protein